MHHIKFIFYCFLGYCLASCQINILKPSELLSKPEMVKVLVEVHHLEALLLERNYHLIDSAQVAFQKAEKELFKKLGMPYARYKKSYDYYLKNQPDVLDEIYNVVIDTLQRREQTLANLPAIVPEIKPDTTLKQSKQRKAAKMRTQNPDIIQRNVQKE